MATQLSAYVSGRDNNFNLLRFVAAFLVLFSHSFALATGDAANEPLKAAIGMTWGGIAVDVFFITSGFLIAGSYLARNNILSFAWARLLRIYPALITANLFSILVVGLWFTTLKPLEFLRDPQTLGFAWKNSTLFFGLEYKLPGTFQDNPWVETVNGSLWTLPFEVKLYTLLSVLLFGVSLAKRKFTDLRTDWILAAAGTCAMGAYLYNHFDSFDHIVGTKAIKLAAMFLIGSTYYALRDKIQLSGPVFWCLSVLLLASSLHVHLFFVAYCLFLPYIVFYLAYVPAGAIRKFNGFGDYSYGLYIYAFPVQQSLAASFPGMSTLVMILTCFPITLLLAAISWHVIEKRSLKWKGSYQHFEKWLGLAK
jgi:peptidoglycan/LPS O-acetylase OafA/YrhL